MAVHVHKVKQQHANVYAFAVLEIQDQVVMQFFRGE